MRRLKTSIRAKITVVLGFLLLAMTGCPIGGDPRRVGTREVKAKGA